MGHERLPYIVMFGKSGAGKGTLGTILSRRLGIPHISTGDMIRHEILEDTPLGRQMAADNKVGKRALDEEIDQLLVKRLPQPDCQTGWILDGYPRRMSQVGTLERLCAPAVVIVLDVSNDIAIKRLSSRRVCANGHSVNLVAGGPEDCLCWHCSAPLMQRTDDTPAGIQQRLHDYHGYAKSITDFYRHPDPAKNRLLEIDGSQPITAVLKNILAKLTTGPWISPDAWHRKP